MLTCWSIYFFCASMTSRLPWATCGNPWNTPACRETSGGDGVQNTTGAPPCVVFGNQTNQTLLIACVNVTNITAPASPSEEYFLHYVLKVSSGIDDVGTLQWPLALCLLASSIISFAALIRGVKSIGKVVYVTVTFPYLILLVLLARYVTLGSNHLDGIKFYVTPQWERLNDAAVWGDAAGQLFFSLGLSMGGLMSLSSYNRFHYDCYRDAYLICLVDTLTSVFAGVVIFAILGVMAAEKGTDVQNVVTSKFALAYIVYPEAVTKLPVAPFWSILFFLMLFCLAIDSQFLMTACLVISITDEFPAVLGHRRVAVIGGVCSGLYIVGLPMASQGGFYMVMLFDQYVVAWTPVVVATLTCVAVTWVYGMSPLINDMRAMLGSAPSLWWQTLWKFVTPLILVVLLVFVWAHYVPPTMDGYRFPDWAHGLGLVLGLGPLLAVPLVACIQLCRTPGSGLVIVRRCMASSEGWGPALKRHRVNIFLPQLPDLEPTWSSNWLAMAKEMSIYATETSAIVAMSAYPTLEVGSKTKKKSREKTVTITTSGSSSDKNIQTDGGLVEEDSVVLVSPCKSPSSRSKDASTQTLHNAHLGEDADDVCLVGRLHPVPDTPPPPPPADPPDTSPFDRRGSDHNPAGKRWRKLSKESQASTASLKSTSKFPKKGSATEDPVRGDDPDVVVSSSMGEHCHSGPPGDATVGSPDLSREGENRTEILTGDRSQELALDDTGIDEQPVTVEQPGDSWQGPSSSGSCSPVDISQGSRTSIDFHMSPSSMPSIDYAISPDSGGPSGKQQLSQDTGTPVHQQISQDGGPGVDQQISHDSGLVIDQQISQNGGLYSGLVIDQQISQDGDLGANQQISHDSGLVGDKQISKDGSPRISQEMSQDIGLVMDPKLSQGSGPAVDKQIPKDDGLSVECKLSKDSSPSVEHISENAGDDNQSLVSTCADSLCYIDDSESEMSDHVYMDTYL